MRNFLKREPEPGPVLVTSADSQLVQTQFWFMFLNLVVRQQSDARGKNSDSLKRNRETTNEVILDGGRGGQVGRGREALRCFCSSERLKTTMNTGPVPLNWTWQTGMLMDATAQWSPPATGDPTGTPDWFQQVVYWSQAWRTSLMF